MKLSAVKQGKHFTFKGERFTHDFDGRSGGGKVAVVNLDSGEKTMLPAAVEVAVIDEVIPPEVLEPAEVELDIPEPAQLVEEDNVNDSSEEGSSLSEEGEDE